MAAAAAGAGSGAGEGIQCTGARVEVVALDLVVVGPMGRCLLRTRRRVAQHVRGGAVTAVDGEGPVWGPPLPQN